MIITAIAFQCINSVLPNKLMPNVIGNFESSKIGKVNSTVSQKKIAL